MADQISPDGVPTWLVAVLSVVTTVAGWKGLGPVARWAGKRLDKLNEQRLAERGDLVSQLTLELRSAHEENVKMRQELGEERELRMSFASDYAVTKSQVEMLTKAIADDKKDCQQAIRALRTEIRDLKRQMGERA